MTFKKGSEMITFNKAGMKEALQGTEQWFSDDHSPLFNFFNFQGEWFPVSLWHKTRGLSFDGKDWDILRLGNKLWIGKGVRLR